MYAIRSYYDLYDALNSINNQTNKQFSVYVGDDNSPEILYDIVRLFEDKIDISYIRFSNNLGGKSLVEHRITSYNVCYTKLLRPSRA